MIIDINLFKDTQRVQMNLEIPYTIQDDYPKNLHNLYYGAYYKDLSSSHSSLFSKWSMIMEEPWNSVKGLPLPNGIELTNIYRNHPLTISIDVTLSQEYLDKFAFNDLVDCQEEDLMEMMFNNICSSIADDIIDKL